MAAAVLWQRHTNKRNGKRPFSCVCSMVSILLYAYGRHWHIANVFIRCVRCDMSRQLHQPGDVGWRTVTTSIIREKLDGRPFELLRIGSERDRRKKGPGENENNSKKAPHTSIAAQKPNLPTIHHVCTAKRTLQLTVYRRGIYCSETSLEGLPRPCPRLR